MAISKLDEILKQILLVEKQWQNTLVELSKQFEAQPARLNIDILRKEQAKLLEALDHIDWSHYKKSEFVKNPDDFKPQDAFSQCRLDEIVHSQSILDCFVDSSQQMISYFVHLKEVLVYKKDKELLGWLIQLKLNQIKRIKSYMDSY